MCGDCNYCFRGWEQYAAVPKGKSVVLNVEQEHERRRRLDDEYSAKLQRDRIRDQAEANMANVQSIYELRAIRQAELDSQTREAKAMTTEDVSLPHSRPHSLWCILVAVGLPLCLLL